MFRFKQFDIIHEKSAQKVTTDSVLLGAWTTCLYEPENILDIGAGTGLLSLMAAQKWPSSKITAIEIEPIALQECNLNFANSIWAQRLVAVNADFLSWDTSSKFDIIICNPPYFTENVRASDSTRDLARYSGNGLDIESLFRKGPELLTTCGSLAVVFPTSRKKEFDFLYNLSPFKSLRMCEVRTVENKQAKLVLAQVSMQEGIDENDSLTIRNSRGEYTSEYLQLTEDFYLFNH